MVTLYTTATCPQCRFLKEKLAEKGIPFTLGDATKQEDITHVPVLELEDGKRLDLSGALRWLSEVKSNG